MSELLLVRHGQATLDGDDYDLLSPVGEEQGAALGRHWARFGIELDRVYVGPRRRHRQTLEAVARVYGDLGLRWPEVVTLEELDEHHGPEVLARHRHRLTDGEDDAGEGNSMRTYLRLFRNGMRLWVRGELETPDGLEPWPAFRQRLARGLERLRRIETGRGRRIAAFTSGGPVAAATGEALGLDDEQVMELSWRVRNATVTEIHFSPKGLGLGAFNAAPHFLDPRHLTFV